MSQEELICSICKRQFPSQQSLARHRIVCSTHSEPTAAASATTTMPSIAASNKSSNRKSVQPQHCCGINHRSPSSTVSITTEDSAVENDSSYQQAEGLVGPSPDCFLQQATIDLSKRRQRSTCVGDDHECYIPLRAITNYTARECDELSSHKVSGDTGTLLNSNLGRCNCRASISGKKPLLSSTPKQGAVDADSGFFTETSEGSSFTPVKFILETPSKLMKQWICSRPDSMVPVLPSGPMEGSLIGDLFDEIQFSLATSGRHIWMSPSPPNKQRFSTPNFHHSLFNSSDNSSTSAETSSFVMGTSTTPKSFSYYSFEDSSKFPSSSRQFRNNCCKKRRGLLRRCLCHRKLPPIIQSNCYSFDLDISKCAVDKMVCDMFPNISGDEKKYRSLFGETEAQQIVTKQARTYIQRYCTPLTTTVKLWSSQSSTPPRISAGIPPEFNMYPVIRLF